MRRIARTLLLVALAILAGLATSELLYRAPAIRAAIARCFGYEKVISPIAEHLRAAAQDEQVSEQEIAHELDLLHDQYADEELFAQMLAGSHLSLGDLRAEVLENLRERHWIEKQIAPQLAVTNEYARQYYEAHRAQFTEPPRYRASHLFLAAPDGSEPERIAAAQSAIQGFAVRRLAGESFAQLVAQASEDDATKSNGGDLGYFSAARMPPEFFAEVEKLGIGEFSAPIRSHLGFHLVQLTDAKPPREMDFEEVHAEIAWQLQNQKRAAAVAQLSEKLKVGLPERHPH